MSCEFPVYSCLHDLFEELGRGFQCLFNIEREDLGRERACRFASFEPEEQDPAALEQHSFSLERERNAIHAVAMEEWSCIEPEDKRLNALEGEDAMRRHAQRRQSADYLLEQGVEALLSLDEEEQKLALHILEDVAQVPDQIGACALIADFDGLAIDDVQIQTRAQLEALKLYLQVKSPAAVLRAYNLGEELTKRLEVIEAPAELRGDAFMAFAEAHIQHIGRDQGALILLETAYNFILGSDDCAKMRKVCLLMAETLEEMGRVDDAKWYRDEADLHQ